MKYFDRYTSATLSAGGPQAVFFNEDENQICRGRVFYRCFVTGDYPVSLLFSNTVDSTFDGGQDSHKNMVCDEWELLSCSLALTDSCDPNAEITDILPVLFQGKENRTVMPGEFFFSDPMTVSLKRNRYLCYDIVFRGRMVTCHKECNIPVFRMTENGWEPNPLVPLPSMIGCEKSVPCRVVFIGDSITQGLGTERNSYEHYAARCAELIEGKGDFDPIHAYWNIAYGFARADDAASDGAWLFKARQGEVAVVCFGVNDLFRGFSVETIVNNLRTIVIKLKDAGLKVILQTVPPFDFSGEYRTMWNEINRILLRDFTEIADVVFDNRPPLVGEDGFTSVYGGHPNGEGCRHWAEALAPVLLSVMNQVTSRQEIKN